MCASVINDPAIRSNNESVMTPLFSVIILTFNRSNFLKAAIESVLNQSYGNFELIIIDDNSTDNTKEVIDSFQDGRIRYFINNRSKGQAGARNSGIAKASGQWVAFLDDDDIWLSGKLEKQQHQISEIDYSIGFLYTGYASYDFDKSEIISVFTPEKRGWIQKEILYKNPIGGICSVAIRKDLFEKAGGFDEKFPSMVDMDMWVRISGLTGIDYINETLVYVRKSNEDRISLNLERKLNGSLLFWEKYRDLINNDPRLRHRAASRVFEFAFQQGNVENVLKSLPWTLSGLFYDFSNFSRTLRIIAGYSYKRIKAIFA